MLVVTKKCLQKQITYFGIPCEGLEEVIVSFLTCLFCWLLAFTSGKQQCVPKYKKNLLENLKSSKILSTHLFFAQIRKSFKKFFILVA